MNTNALNRRIDRLRGQQHTQGYIVIKSTQDQRLGTFGQECERQCTPLIYVLKKGKIARVEMDLIFVENTQRFNKNKVFQDKMFDACEQAAGDYRNSFYPGLYTVLNRVPIENAETLAQAFYAIYQQTIGQDVPMPVFEHPAVPGKVRSRLLEAIERGYAIARGVADRLPLRYQLWCDAHQRPYICVWIRREGYAELNASWEPGQATNLEDIQAQLRRIAEEWGVRHDAQRSTGYRGGPILSIRDGYVGNIHFLRMEAAEHLAGALVRLLRIQKGESV